MIPWKTPSKQVCSHAKFGTFWKPFSTMAILAYSYWHANFGIDPKLAETGPLFCRATDEPFSTNYGTFPIDPKLAETAPLLYRATDVPFLPKMEQEPKLVETVFYQLWHFSN